MIEYLEELFERATTPVSEEKPCGENARYDTRYDTVKTEIMKMTAGASGVNWDSVRNNIDELLQQETKDLTLAAYLSLTLLKQYQYKGLLTGLKIITSFLDTWWESMFPPAKRAKARIQIFEWMDERLSVLVHVTEPKEDEAEALRQCKEVLDRLPQKVQELAKAQVTGFGQLRTEINQWVGQLPEDKPQVSEEVAPEKPEEVQVEAAKSSPQESPSEEKKDVPPKDASAAAKAPAAKAPTPAPAKKIELPPVSAENLENMDAGVKAILDIVKILREIDPLAAISYRLSRILKWELVMSAPPAELDGKTKMLEPNRERLELLKTQLGAGNWPALTKTAEHMFVTGGVFFIDLQRYVHQGLLNQGAESAAEAVQMESGKFLNRLPEVLDLTYASGMPLADQETRQWAGDAMKAAAAGSGNDSGGDMEIDSETLKEAKQAAVKNLAAALPKLQDAISEATNTKNQMRTQLEVAKLFVDNRAYPWAMPILKNLYSKIDTVQLVEWAPEFCVDVWDLMLRGYNAMPDAAAKAVTGEISREEIGQKLFSVNVARAAALTPRDKKK